MKSFPPGTKQVLFPFTKPRKGSLHDGLNVTMCVPTLRAFLPLGLFVWGATADSYARVTVGPQHEVSLSLEPIPARYFSEGRSMADLQKLADQGELGISVEQRRLLEMEVAEIGMNVCVQMTGPFEDVCLWGLTYAQRWPLLTQAIEPVKSPVTFGIELGDGYEGFRGRVIEHHLGGDRVISHVFAPSEQSVAALLIAARRPERLY